MTLFSFPGSRLRIDHDEVEAGAVEQRDQGFAKGQRTDTGDDLLLGRAGRDGDIGAGLAVDLVENLGQAGAFGRDAQTSTVVRDLHFRDGLGRRGSIGDVIEVRLYRRLLLVGHEPAR